jgi:hypothetical protein
MRAALLACAAAAALGTGPACAGATWPEVHSVADPGFAGGQRPVTRLDILPIDLQVWTGAGSKQDPNQLSRSVTTVLGGAVAAEMAERGYQVTAQMDWDGRYVAPDGLLRSAMSEEDVAGTAYALSGYGEAQRRASRELGTGGMLVPFLPARLGEETGADATLYVGGWAFSGRDKRRNKASQVAKVVLVVAVVAVVVVAIAAAIKSDGGASKALGGVARGASKAASHTARLATRVIRPVGRLATRATAAMVRSRDGVEAAVHAVDALGRSITHLDVYAGRPNYYRSGGPRKGRSAMQLEMTLVDNRTGRVLWHARQRFPARPSSPREVARAASRLLAAMPAAG